MKPLNLKIKGINIFNEEQEINFSKFIGNGLFGIFGDTGSGKSSIIDAITLSLYGKMSRYKGKKGNGDFINLNRKDARVLFKFSIKEEKQEVFYEVMRSFKREKDGSVKSDLVRFCKLKGDEVFIISDKKNEIETLITKIIGLNYDDFTRAVVLPQGKFSEFLMLENLDKRKMLQRIFGLEKYGEKLTKKINEKKANLQIEINSINDKIEFYGEVNEETILAKKEEFEKYENELKYKEDKLKNITLFEESLKFKLKLKEEFEDYNFKLNQLLEYSEFVKNLKVELENSKKANLIKPKILELEILEEDRNKLQILEKDTFINLENLKNFLIETEETYESFKNYNKQNIPSLENLKIQIENCIILNKDRENFLNEKSQIEKEIKSNLEIKLELEKEGENITLEKDLIEQKIHELDNFKKQNEIDKNLKDFWKEVNEIKKEIEYCRKNLEEVEILIKNEENFISLLKIEVKNIEKDIDLKNFSLGNIIFSNKKSMKTQLEKNLDNFNKNNDEIKKLEEKLEFLDSQIKLQENKEFLNELVESLQDGKPCPICGGKEHPNPVKILLEVSLEKFKTKKQEINKNIKDIENNNNKILKENSGLENSINNLQEKLDNLDINTKNFIYEEIYIKPIDEIFKILNLKNNEILEIKQKISKIYSNIENKEILIKDNLLNKKKYLNNIEAFEKTLNIMGEKFNITDFDTGYEKFLKQEEIFYNKNNELSLKREELEKIFNFQNTFKQKMFEIEKSLITLNVLKDEKDESIKYLNQKVKKYDYIEDLDAYLDEISNKIEICLNRESNYKEKFDKISKEKLSCENEFQSIKLRLDIILKTIQEKHERLNEELILNKMEKHEVLNLCLDFERENKIEEKLKRYSEKFDNYKINLAIIEKEFEKIEGENIKEKSIEEIRSKFEETSNLKENLETENKDLFENILKLKVEIQNGKNALKEVLKLKSDLKPKIKKIDILEEISKINKGGAFLQYVAKNQLKHIILDASKRLENMSNNKFSFRLIGTEFAINDNFNGGILRSVRSLSGGEIFMASLSLALSLSSKIQLTNNAPLEVFFLDEGFGTLDNNLLETVVTTLENLQSSNISVGIITHVEELKNRVQNKIVLQSKDEKGVLIEID